MSDTGTAGIDRPAPDPSGALDLDELVGRLRELRVWSGLSYREVHRRVARLRAARGVPEAPVYNTVYRALRPGRARIDVDLLVDVAAVMLGDEVRALAWRQAYQAISGQADAAAVVTVSDTLPAELPGFTGRRVELDRLSRLADDGTGRAAVSTIHGMPGVGKTALAVHAAHRLSHVCDMRFSVNLRGYDPDSPPADPAAVLEAFLRRLGCPPERIAELTLASRSEEYRRRLDGRRALILLDNAASEEQVRPLLPDGPGCVALVTSRRDFEGIPGARRIALDVFSPEEAQTMLRGAAGERRVIAEPGIAERLADAVGRLPLAVGLVASRIRSHPGWRLADHLERLVERRESLRLDSAVETALALSYHDLPAADRGAFRLLALVPARSFDAYVAAALQDTDPGTAQRRLDALVAANLLQRHGSGGCEFHDLVRVYAAGLARDQDPASARRAALLRLFDHYRHTAALAMDRYAPHEKERRPWVADPGGAAPTFPDRDAALAWLDSQRASLVAAALAAAKLGSHRHTSDLSRLLFRYLDIGAHHADAETLHGCAAQSPDPVARAHALTSLANGRLRTGQSDIAAGHLRESLALFRAHGDREAEGRALGQLGSVLERQGRYQEALDCFRDALARGEQAGDLRSVGVSLNNIGVVHERLCEHLEALAHYRRAVEVLRELGDRRGEARILSNLGTVCASLGKHQEARGHLEQSLAIARETGDRRGEAAGLNDLGAVLRAVGAPPQALVRHQDAWRIAEEFGEVYEQARAADGIACSHTELGDLDAARTHWRKALDLHAGMNTPEAEAIATRLADLDRARR